MYMIPEFYYELGLHSWRFIVFFKQHHKKRRLQLNVYFPFYDEINKMLIA